MVGTALCDAPYAAWLVGPGGDDPSALHEAPPVVNERDADAPVMRRETLRCLRPVPDVVTAWPAANEVEARTIAARLAAAPVHGRPAVTRTLAIR